MTTLMRWALPALSCLLSFSTIEGSSSLQSLTQQIEDSSLNVGYTYRQDALNWNIGFADGTPNILSELSWKDLYIHQVTAVGTVTTKNQFYLRGIADYGQIYHGRNQDSDYLGDNRTFEFSRSINKANKGEVFDLSIAVGRLFSSQCHTIRLVPLIGYSLHEQHLKMTDGDQVLFLLNPASEGPIEGLDSSYNAKWFGPWVGVDLFFDYTPTVTFFGTFEYHYSTFYRGEGDWNLRTDFLDNFHHKAQGHGLSGALGLKYHLYANWELSLIASYQKWTTKKGNHTVLVDLDGVFALAGAQLNRVNWHSGALTAAAGYSF